MRLLIQKVKQASVTIDNKMISSIEQGYLVLVGFGNGDDESILQPMVDKLLQLRIIPDENDRMNLSICDVNQAILSVSQFTLYANCQKGRRPSFTDALDPALATILYDKFNQMLKDNGVIVKTGVFGGDMQVALINDGPITIMLDSDIILKK